MAMNSEEQLQQFAGAVLERRELIRIAGCRVQRHEVSAERLHLEHWVERTGVQPRVAQCIIRRDRRAGNGRLGRVEDFDSVRNGHVDFAGVIHVGTVLLCASARQSHLRVGTEAKAVAGRRRLQ